MNMLKSWALPSANRLHFGNIGSAVRFDANFGFATSMAFDK